MASLWNVVVKTLASLGLALGGSARSSGAAEDGALWKVEGKLSGKTDGDGFKRSRDVSGIACDRSSGFPRECLVVDDNGQHAQFVRMEEGRLVALDRVALIDDAFQDNGEAIPLELDGEAVAFSDGAYYVLGSHGSPRRRDGKSNALIAARIAAGGKLFKITRKAGGGAEVSPAVSLRDRLKRQPLLCDHVDQPLEANGLTIEGLAVLGGRAFVGFRGPAGLQDPAAPSGGGKAAILEIDVAALFAGRATPPDVLHLVGLKPGDGVRDLTAIGDDLLILAGPAGDVRGTYAIHRWSPDTGALAHLRDLPDIDEGDAQAKPEALTVLDGAADDGRVLVLFDGAKEGAPRAFGLTPP